MFLLGVEVLLVVLIIFLQSYYIGNGSVIDVVLSGNGKKCLDKPGTIKCYLCIQFIWGYMMGLG